MTLIRFRQMLGIVAAAILVAASPSASFAQSTAAPVVTGYLTSSGCSYGQTTCFVQFGAAGGLYSGPLASQLPSSLGAKAGASSLSVVPNADTPFPIVGNVASGSTDSGNPAKIGCPFNTTRPTFSTGQRGDCQIDAHGSFGVAIWDSGGVAEARVFAPSSDTNASTTAGLAAPSFGLIFNGSTWDRTRSIQGADGSGLGVSAVSASPNSSPNSGIAPTTAALSTNALKASAGNAFSVGISNGTTAGCLILYDSATTPTSGTALTAASIKFHALVAASVSYNQDFIWPKSFTAGIQLLFSTTCTTYTTPATLPVLLTGEAK